MSTQSIRILLIEDQASVDTFVQETLEQPDVHLPSIEVVRTQDLDAGLSQVSDETVDIVLLDFSSPDTLNLSDLNAVHTRNPNIPIVVLTKQDDTMATYALDIGAEYYLIKERLSSESLVYALLCAVERRRMRKQLQTYAKELQQRETRFQNLIARNPDGVVVVDTSGTVRFMNPAAELLFGRKTEDVLGEMFGFPIVAGETTEIDIVPRESDGANIAELRVVETEWENELAYLITLRDISEHKKLQESLRYSEQLNRLILYSIDAHIVVVDETGRVVVMNNSWNHFTRGLDHASFEDTRIGSQYFDACKQVFGEASRMHAGIQSVLHGEVDSFDFEYKHNVSDTEECWFYIRIMSLLSNSHRYLVITYNDVTERKRVAWAEAEAKSNAARIKEQEREIRGLLQLSGSSSSTSITSSLFGAQPLSEGAPLVFEEISRHYDRLIEMAMEQRAYKVDHGLSEELRSMAERLGFLKAGPRDVVEIHSKVLQAKSVGANTFKIRAYTEEGRLMIIELMGHLVSYYRNQSLGISKTYASKPSS